MDNYKNVPSSLYGLNPSQMDMFLGEDNIISRQTAALTEESMSARYNYVNNGGMYTTSGKNENVSAKYSMSMSAHMSGGRGFGRPRTAPPDLPSLLLDSRIVYLGMPIVTSVTELITAQFLWLDYDSDKPIYLYINSTGTLDEQRQIVGSDTDAFTIADLMNRVQGKVYTINLGMAYGQAAMLLAAGAKGYRAVLPSSYTKLYMPSVSSSSGPSIDMWIKAKELDSNTESYLELLSIGIGKPVAEIAKDVVRGLYMGAQEAVEYGIADKIMYTLEEEFDRKDYVAMSAERKGMRQKLAIQTATPRVGQSPR
jgi:ATP-dependent Clp protease protease subunit